jgi:F420H(2)-dependent quinone reductase
MTENKTQPTDSAQPDDQGHPKDQAQPNERPQRVDAAAMRRRSGIFRLVNVPMRAVLSLPFRTPLSRNLMLVRYTGRKSGRVYRQPLSYARDGEALLTPGGGRWTLNMEGGRPVRIRLRGRDVSARPELVREPGEVERLLDVIVRENPPAARYIPLPRLADGRLEPNALAAAIEHGFAIVRWNLA